LAWTAFAGWALARRPLFALDRVVGAWLAVTFSTLTTLGMVTIAVSRADAVVVVACGALGATLTVLAGTVLARARARRRALLARRDELHRLAGGQVTHVSAGTQPTTNPPSGGTPS
jgi:hypothetical protein